MDPYAPNPFDPYADNGIDPYAALDPPKDYDDPLLPISSVRGGMTSSCDRDQALMPATRRRDARSGAITRARARQRRRMAITGEGAASMCDQGGVGGSFPFRLGAVRRCCRSWASRSR